eukprot:TRINITY_DN13591_c0_g1_i11.p1 TRINITY_DN13591_c0_g1~~TRINITY_DN13591_c0_g1_i11.p1  ORF type:complete len:311 (-),score=57.02 TRINITY_DN13591_c0_g1_i11:510-1442(-)
MSTTTTLNVPTGPKKKGKVKREEAVVSTQSTGGDSDLSLYTHMSQDFFLLTFIFSLFIYGEAKLYCSLSKLDPEDPSVYCSEMYLAGKLEAGSLCLVRPERIFPTQVYVGKTEMHCVQQELEKLDDGDLGDRLLENNVPTVVGPEGNLYLIDHHHFGLALFEAFLDFKRPMIHKVLYACVQVCFSPNFHLHSFYSTKILVSTPANRHQADYSNYSLPVFWRIMENRNYVLLRDERGNNISVSDLPTSLKALRDNPYRSLASWVRHSNGYVKCGSKGTTHLDQCLNAPAPFFFGMHLGRVFVEEISTCYLS